MGLLLSILEGQWRSALVNILGGSVGLPVSVYFRRVSGAPCQYFRSQRCSPLVF